MGRATRSRGASISQCPSPIVQDSVGGGDPTLRARVRSPPGIAQRAVVGFTRAANPIKVRRNIGQEGTLGRLKLGLRRFKTMKSGLDVPVPRHRHADGLFEAQLGLGKGNKRGERHSEGQELK